MNSAIMGKGRTTARGGVVRIGDGIGRENEAALDANFAEDSIDGPDDEMDFPQVKAAFAALRVTFSDFNVLRPMIVFQGGLRGRPARRWRVRNLLEVPACATLQPNVHVLTSELIGFRYDAEGSQRNGCNLTGSSPYVGLEWS